MIKLAAIAGCAFGAYIALSPTDGNQHATIGPPLAPIQQQAVLQPVPGPYHPVYPTADKYPEHEETPTPYQAPDQLQQPELYKCAQGILHCGQPLI